jgi:hypothetical protein
VVLSNSSSTVVVGGYASGQDPATLLASSFSTVATAVATVAAQVWAYATRTLSAFGFNVEVGSYASGQNPATLVLGATASAWDTAGTIGFLLNQAPIGFNGMYEVTFEFKDASGNAVDGVQFQVEGVGQANTGSAGSITLSMNNGTYAVAAAPTNQVMWACPPLVVGGATAYAIEGTAVPAPSAPSDPTLSTPYVYVWPEVAGVSATLQCLNLPQNVQSLWLGPIVSIETSNSSGLITFASFPIGSQVRLTIPDRGVARQYVLSEGSQELI